jgi:NAD(P)-dependent dehydrogenase (short-subunit alcohol dehydrogenase family)
MDLNLDGKGVVITGGASNIGRALTLGFAEEGANVLIADVDEAQAEAVIAAGPEGRISQRRTDVTNADEVTATIDHAIETLGGVDVLVNCAGLDRRPPVHRRSRARSGSARSRSTCGASSTPPARCSTT